MNADYADEYPTPAPWGDVLEWDAGEDAITPPWGDDGDEDDYNWYGALLGHRRG